MQEDNGNGKTSGLFILTDDDLIRDYKLNLSFINLYARKMGSFGRNPRKFIREIVENFLQQKALDSLKKGYGNDLKAAEAARKKAQIVELVDYVLNKKKYNHTPMSPEEMAKAEAKTAMLAARQRQRAGRA
ncbi:MAG: hypothetical protein A2077_01400 [Nitrospirae bacterium GWC2_46_6]|nr:MAG: hypothetical protein A2077_01400 [Nitrospirae bacterium GWC2_46_6]OGW23058.1 MAG: hypothetical protein A2X55_08780 [Nitrospirae bacterium GWB2_47_37]HAK87605.1 hypothetical protein [Nitrospiraceae bacterium]HCL81348.1 hypothetical protein [Nitrospiraceae bacterium]